MKQNIKGLGHLVSDEKIFNVLPIEVCAKKFDLSIIKTNLFTFDYPRNVMSSF